MADYNRTTGDPVEFNSKLAWGNAFHRSGPAPLDRTSLFVSYTDALNYATGQGDIRGMGGSAYPGQIITVLSSDTATPEVYVIKGAATVAGRTLIPIGEGGGGSGGASGGYDAQINWRSVDDQIIRYDETWVRYTNGMWDRDINISGSLSGNNTSPTSQIPEIEDADIVDIGNGVNSIGAAAFYNCNNIKEVIITSQSVGSIGENAFYGCTGLQKIDCSSLDSSSTIP